MTERPPALRDAIRRLRIELSILNDRVAGAAGLNPRDLDILDVVDREGPCTPSWLAQRTGQRPATLTSVLSRLERDGWVLRTADPEDGRSVSIASTDRFDELRALYGPADAVAASAVGDLTAHEQAIVAAALGRVAERLASTMAGAALPPPETSSASKPATRNKP